MMERDSGPDNAAFNKYKEDIDDNCPMTGDETDTEPFLYKEKLNTLHLSDVENELREISKDKTQEGKTSVNCWNVKENSCKLCFST